MPEILVFHNPTPTSALISPGPNTALGHHKGCEAKVWARRGTRGWALICVPCAIRVPVPERVTTFGGLQEFLKTAITGA